MSKIKVMVVDDAVVIRHCLQDILNADPHIVVMDVAANGKIALAKIKQSVPDVVILDIEMPEMDGLETLKQLRPVYPRLPVIMFSTHTRKGASLTLDALTLGANDYVLKPELHGNPQQAVQVAVQTELIPRIKALVPHGEKSTVIKPTTTVISPPQIHPKSRIDIVAIGVSTGGPNALSSIFQHLPADLPVPIVIVQHMPTFFTGLLAERLTYLSPVRVHEAKDGDILHPGQAWLAPGNFHMTVKAKALGTQIQLNQEEPEHSCRPSVDVLFRSVAEVYKNHVLAVILTGMGKDGLNGCEQIAQVGGQIFAQDEASSVVWGMPGFVAKAGLADKVLPLEQMASEIVRCVMLKR